MFENPQFVKSVFRLDDIIKSPIPEVILCGRSNVGKSSLINSLFNRKNLAKTSSTPGKTRSINYYLIGDKFYLVDLPGFGYAKISKKEREYWAKLVEGFINRSQNIQFAFHLIDSRHKATELDIKLNNMLNYYRLPYGVILSKIDKLKQSELSEIKKKVIKSFPELIFGQNLFFYSSIKKTGKKELLSHFSKLFYL
ncbi:MAG TPA: ribosome biogenesis GTP-binding protein YihA/YsxC [Ignavibacteriaceae bacterium]|nr:ribosome biogenesis GTP-binding protein YihA/YsxC [Ignavibacteriaceae bacterium]